MQINNALSKINNSRNLIILRWTIFGVMLWYLYSTFSEKGQGLLDVWAYISHHISTANVLLLVFLVLLTPVNWGFEALKWQVLAQKVENISFSDAFKGVLAGLSLGFIMPTNVGDAAGRVMALKTDQRLKAIGAALLASGFQFFVSLLFGTIGWGSFVFLHPALQTWFSWLILFLCTSILIIGLWLGSNRRQSSVLLKRFGWFRFIDPYVIVIVQYSRSELQKAFIWALLRYLVFSIQFLVLMSIFEIQIPIFDALMSIFLVFFAKTLIPALNFLGDLGVRESASLFVFGFYAILPAAVIGATLTLWFINIFVPVLFGSFWFLNVRYFKS